MEAKIHESPLKVHVFRLLPGDDLYQSLKSYVTSQKIEAACILTCVGSLQKIHVRTSRGVKFLETTDFFEITSLTGCISPSRAHLHITLCDGEGKAIGGHLMREGNIVFTTAEIVLGVMSDLKFEEQKCEKSGWPELVILNK